MKGVVFVLIEVVIESVYILENRQEAVADIYKGQAGSKTAIYTFDEDEEALVKQSQAFVTV